MENRLIYIEKRWCRHEVTTKLFERAREKEARVISAASPCCTKPFMPCVARKPCVAAIGFVPS